MAGNTDTPILSPRSPLLARMVIRGLIFALTLAVACLFLTSKEITDVYDIQADAQYTYSTVFLYLAIVDIVAFATSLVSLIFEFVLINGALGPSGYFCIFLYDLILGALLGTGCGTATTIGWVGKYGNNHVGWIAICDHFGRFCHKVIASIAVSYMGFCLSWILAVMFAKKTK